MVNEEGEKNPPGNSEKIVIEVNSVNNMKNSDIEEIRNIESFEKGTDGEGIEETRYRECTLETRDSEGTEETRASECMEKVKNSKGIQEISGSESIREISDSESIPEISHNEDIWEISHNEGIREISDSESIREISDSESMPEISDSESIREISDSESIREISDSEEIEENSDSEGIKEMASFLLLQKRNLDSLLQIHEESIELYNSTFNLFKTIQRNRITVNRATFLNILNRKVRVSSNFRTAKSYISHIEDLFQILEAIMESPSKNLKSLFPNHARQLVHTLEKAERCLSEAMNDLKFTAHSCRRII